MGLAQDGSDEEPPTSLLDGGVTTGEAQPSQNIGELFFSPTAKIRFKEERKKKGGADWIQGRVEKCLPCATGEVNAHTG